MLVFNPKTHLIPDKSFMSPQHVTLRDTKEPEDNCLGQKILRPLGARCLLFREQLYFPSCFLIPCWTLAKDFESCHRGRQVLDEAAGAGGGCQGEDRPEGGSVRGARGPDAVQA